MMMKRSQQCLFVFWHKAIISLFMMQLPWFGEYLRLLGSRCLNQEWSVSGGQFPVLSFLVTTEPYTVPVLTSASSPSFRLSHCVFVGGRHLG